MLIVIQYVHTFLLLVDLLKFLLLLRKTVLSTRYEFRFLGQFRKADYGFGADA